MQSSGSKGAALSIKKIQLMIDRFYYTKILIIITALKHFI